MVWGGCCARWRHRRHGHVDPRAARGGAARAGGDGRSCDRPCRVQARCALLPCWRCRGWCSTDVCCRRVWPPCALRRRRRPGLWVRPGCGHRGRQRWSRYRGFVQRHHLLVAGSTAYGQSVLLVLSTQTVGALLLRLHGSFLSACCLVVARAVCGGATPVLGGRLRYRRTHSRVCALRDCHPDPGALGVVGERHCLCGPCHLRPTPTYRHRYAVSIRGSAPIDRVVPRGGCVCCMLIAVSSVCGILTQLPWTAPLRLCPRPHPPRSSMSPPHRIWASPRPAPCLP